MNLNLTQRRLPGSVGFTIHLFDKETGDLSLAACNPLPISDTLIEIWGGIPAGVSMASVDWIPVLRTCGSMLGTLWFHHIIKREPVLIFQNWRTREIVLVINKKPFFTTI